LFRNPGCRVSLRSHPGYWRYFSTGYTAGMHVSPSRLGGIEEIESGLRWDAAALGAEIGRRAAQLSGLGLPRASPVAIAHGGSADFFADLLAVFSLGATAICLDPALTPSERANVVAFAKPDVILVSSDPASWIVALNEPLCRARGADRIQHRANREGGACPHAGHAAQPFRSWVDR